MTRQNSPTNIAIIGSGIAGLGLAYNLNENYNFTIFEKSTKYGGHIHSVNVMDNKKNFPIDIGFMVFNQITYPNFCNLINKLNVEIYPSDMSFSVNYRPLNLEWNGGGISKIFAQRKNLLNLKFWKFLFELDRFNKLAPNYLEKNEHISIKEFINQQKFSKDFLNLYLIPIASAIWSINPNNILEFPITTLYQFFYNHGFLGLNTHFQWYTIKNSTNKYLNLLTQKFQNKIITNSSIKDLFIENDKVKLIFNDNSVKLFDKCVLATHADEALNILKHPTKLESDILNKFSYEKNLVTVHCQENVMPNNINAWGAWNWRVDKFNSQYFYSTHYWVNKLQNIPSTKNFYVSLNAKHLIRDENKFFEDNLYHPQFTKDSIQAQAKINELNQQYPKQHIYFCGSYFKYAFHEDAYTSALNLSHILNEV